MNRKTKKQKTLVILTILFVCFIYGNSLMPGDISSLESGFVFDILNTFSKIIGIDISITEHFVRKGAHFTEYAVLGILLMSTKMSYVRNILEDIFNVLFLGLFIPVIDETIQLFVEGRSGQISDVILDFSGVIAGIIITSILCIILNKSKKYR